MQLILKKIQIFLNKGSMRLIKKTYYTNWCFFNLPRSHQLNFDWHKKWPFNKLWHFEAPYTMFDLFFCAVKGFFLDVSTVFWMFYVFFGYLWMFWDVLSLFGGCGGMSLEQLTQTLIGCKPQRLGWMARDWKFDFQLESRYSLNVFLWIGKPRKIEIIISRPLQFKWEYIYLFCFTPRLFLCLVEDHVQVCFASKSRHLYPPVPLSLCIEEKSTLDSDKKLWQWKISEIAYDIGLCQCTQVMPLQSKT